MEMFNKLKLIESKYGYVMLTVLLDNYEYKEQYEICEIIEQKIKETKAYFGIKINRIIDKNFMEDYVCGFWKLGLSGDVAYNNFPFYVLESLKIMEE